MHELALHYQSSTTTADLRVIEGIFTSFLFRGHLVEALNAASCASLCCLEREARDL